MKQVKFLILGVIGMIAFTATATTTAKLETKPKQELFSEPKFVIDSVVVTNELNFETAVLVLFVQNYVIPVKKDNNVKVVSAIVSDVGWRMSKAKYSEIHYKEKLLENYNLNILQDVRNQDLNIRSDC